MSACPCICLSLCSSVYLSVCVYLFVFRPSVSLSICRTCGQRIKKQDVKIKFRPKFIALWTYLINRRDDRIFDKSILSYIPNMEILGADRFI